MVSYRAGTLTHPPHQKQLGAVPVRVSHLCLFVWFGSFVVVLNLFIFLSVACFVPYIASAILSMHDVYAVFSNVYIPMYEADRFILLPPTTFLTTPHPLPS